MHKTHKAVFCDRDGVINRDFGYVGSRDRFELLPGIPEALHTLRQMGYLLVLVTNQSGIARGMYTEQDFHIVTDFMQELLQPAKACFDAVYFCPHHPDAPLPAYKKDCPCRKPRPGMILQALQELNISPAESVLVGDHASDLQAGAAAGLGQLVLVGTHTDTEFAKVQALRPDTLCYADLPSFVAALCRKEQTAGQ